MRTEKTAQAICETVVETTKAVLAECGQSHLLKYWQDLREDEQKALLQQIQSINVAEAVSLYKQHQKSGEDGSTTICGSKLTPVPIVSAKDIDVEVINSYKELGYQEIANGHVAVIVLAGGQATRLGMALPKGLCSTALPSAKTLLQIQAERIKRLKQIIKNKTQMDAQIHWYVMTSKVTHMLIEKFFEENKYFGLDREHVTLFQQGELPCFDFEGNILLEERDSIALSPDGNGGIYKAIKETGVLRDLKKKNVKYVHVHSVDNILIKVADPVFIGKCVKDNVDCAAKVVLKTDPTEPLGLICKMNDKVQVIEYSEVLKEMAELREGDDLKFNIGNICNHFFTVDFLEKVCTEHESKLPVHIAKKNIRRASLNGEKYSPLQPNGFKLEKFMFDAFAFSQNFLAWQVDRSEEFSPVKNDLTCDKDNFKTARKDLLSLHKKWLKQNGYKVKGDGVEVSSLLSYEGEGLENLQKKSYNDGEVIYAPEEIKGIF